MTAKTRPKTKPLRQPDEVVAEIRRRRKVGHRLISSANRGDWLYAAAVRRFGSWGAAVEAAGYEYAEIEQAAPTKKEALHENRCECKVLNPRHALLCKEEVVERIREMAARGEPLLRSRGDNVLAHGAVQRFGSWKAAVEAAGFELQRFPKWTSEAVVARIREDHRSGLSVRATEVIEREEALYKAGRQRFGSWGAALKAADPSLPKPRRGRPTTPSRPGVASPKTGRRPARRGPST